MTGTAAAGRDVNSNVGALEDELDRLVRGPADGDRRRVRAHPRRRAAQEAARPLLRPDGLRRVPHAFVGERPTRHRKRKRAVGRAGSGQRRAPSTAEVPARARQRAAAAGGARGGGVRRCRRRGGDEGRGDEVLRLEARLDDVERVSEAAGEGTWW